MAAVQDWYLYLLQCADGSVYTGITTDVARRERQHRSGRGAKAVRSAAKQPVKVVWSCRCGDRSRASRLEAAVKKLPRREKLEIISRGGLPESLLLPE